MRENEEQTYTCSECGAVVDEGNLHTFDEHVLCDECLERLMVTYFAFHRKASLITINSILSIIRATSIVSGGITAMMLTVQNPIRIIQVIPYQLNPERRRHTGVSFFGLLRLPYIYDTMNFALSRAFQYIENCVKHNKQISAHSAHFFKTSAKFSVPMYV